MQEDPNWRTFEGSAKISNYLDHIGLLGDKREAKENILELGSSSDEESVEYSLDALEDELRSLMSAGEQENASMFAKFVRLVGLVTNRVFWMRLGLWSFCVSFLFVLSLALYAALYQIYIPKHSHSIPVYFDHSLHSPTANVSIASMLKAKQKYSFTLRLVVPDSPVNSKLGNFMIEFAMLSTKNIRVLQLRKPVFSWLMFRALSHMHQKSSRTYDLYGDWFHCFLAGCTRLTKSRYR